jgi:hypothetical protein
MSLPIVCTKMSFSAESVSYLPSIFIQLRWVRSDGDNTHVAQRTADTNHVCGWLFLGQ